MAAKVAPEGFTRRQVDALDREGLTPVQIAEALAITPQAVNYHLKRIRAERERQAAAR